MTNDPQRFERSLRAWMTDARPPLADREARIHDILAALEEEPRSEPGILARWLDRGTRPDRRRARHHAPETASRHRSMLNASAIVALLAVVAVAVSSVQRSPALPAAPPGDTLVVAADGSGDFTTISAAVQAAADGDTILVRPGSYDGPVDIATDITLRGLGPASDVRLVVAGTAPRDSEYPFGLRLRASDSTVGNLSIVGPSGSVGIMVSGGSPTLEGLILGLDDEHPETEDDSWTAFYLDGRSTPVVRGSRWDGYLAVRGGSAATIEDNTILASTVSIDGPGVTTLRGNRFQEGASTSISWHARGSIEANEFDGGGGIGIDTQSDVSVVGNTVRGEGIYQPAIFVRDAGTRATVKGNTVVDSNPGIQLGSGTAATVTGNVLLDNRTGVAIQTSGADVSDNSIEGGTFGIQVLGRVAPRISGNSIQSADQQGLYVGRNARPTILQNAICGSHRNLFLATGAEPILEENEVCEDEPTE